ncbi:hypothetical protein IC229_34845 [Spirosoma sp. BT702]|uniref:Histidine kinase/HSP90-like ATPase domain-containing protein n=1 Tax=Spirosoma profusum TaxID=2771354 RepID=A0A927AWN7_9BACT|nr:ATP-binding protein [Spirosoma profusum]MBD2705830.1 hypothetical protein [Spirosoma profusum]
MVENAFVHGLEKVSGQIYLTIQSQLQDNQLLIRIEDNGLGFRTKQPNGRSGVGISNTRQRLYQSYGESASLRFEQPMHGGTAVVLTLPFMTETDMITSGILGDTLPI